MYSIGFNGQGWVADVKWIIIYYLPIYNPYE